MGFWWDLKHAISDSTHSIISLIRTLLAWCIWRRRQFIQAYKSMTLGTFFAILSSIATVCAAAASGMSYMVSRDSQRVADESLAITKAIDLRNQLQQRAIVTVRSASIGQYEIRSGEGSEMTVVTTVSLGLKNSGQNPAGWIRLRGGTFANTETVESGNAMANDSEQLFVLEFKHLKIESDTKLHFGFEYWDEAIKKCFYGKVEYKLARDPNNPMVFVPTPIVFGEADDVVRRLKEDSHCARFANAAIGSQP